MSEPSRSAPTSERPVTPPAPAPRAATPAPEAGTEGAGNTAVSGLLADGGFLIKLGDGIRLSATDLGNGAILRADLRAREDLRVPGVRLTEFSYNTRQGSGELKAQLTIPQVEQSELRLIVERDGRTRLRGTVNINTQLGVLNNPRLRLGIGEDDHFTAQIEISGAQLVPRGVRKLTITGGGTLRLTSGKFSGDMGFDLAYDGLGSGRVNLRFSELGEATGDGRVNITHPVLNGAEATLAIQGGDVTADVLVPAARLQPPVPGLTLGDGNVHITFRNHQLSGGLEGVNLSYRDLGSALLNARFERDHLEGSADLTLNIPGLSTANGTLGYNRDGRFYGSFAIGANSFPEGLPIESGELRGAVGANGQISFSGSIGVVLGPAGRGQLNARYEGGVADISATVTLNNLPGLNAATVNVRLINGDLEGSADLSIDSERLPGFSTTLHVEYKEQRWSAEQALAFSVDDGKLSGDFTLGIRQNEDNSLSVYGSGDLTARIAPNLEGSLGATLNEDGTIDTRGEIRVPEPIELFPEKRADRELFRHSQNIPLWAILVAVIRIRAGLRAGVGPGVLRDITVSGEYTIGGDEDPSLSVSGELYIPAFAEAYVAIGAGLGLDVALGSLTGGIEAMATAGIYGAISVIPELAYENGDYLINGTATLAAGAKFKLGLNAWAEIEALWVTVWEKEWQLAEWVWNLGPTLALQARLSYNFSRPEPPELTFDTENVPNMDQMVQDAMPRDRPAGSGAREAMRNRAEWAGPTRQAQQAAPLPDALTQQSQAAPQPAQAPQAGSGGGAPQPGQQPVPGRAPGAAGAAPAPGSTGASPATPGAAGAPPSPVAAQAQTQGAQSQAPAEQALPSAEAPVSDTPRHPDNPGLSALDLPPVAVPRTADQQQADLTAAGRVLNAAMAAAETSEQLAAYFPRLQQRYQLSEAAFVEEGTGIKVRLSINPAMTVVSREIAQGTGIAGKTTRITYGTGNLGGHDVGVSMVADPLGPDHPLGSSPSAQAGLMALLPTDQTLGGDRRYIRGHLLNDQVGGVGAARNLFPITHQANQAHESQIESRVKQWVNTQRYWVYYRVTVSLNGHQLDASKPVVQNYVNASLACEAAVYDLKGDKHNTLTATIVSTYTPPGETQATDFAAVTGATGPTRDAETAVAVRPEDLAASVQLPARLGEYQLDADIKRELDAAMIRKGRAEVDSALLTIANVGSALITTLHATAARFAEGNLVGVLSKSEKSNLTRLNLLKGAILAKLRGLV